MSAGYKAYAPASVANVACGFDVLGFALGRPGDEIIAKPGIEPGLKITKITGDGGLLPYDVQKNTAGVAALALLEALDRSREPIGLEIHKKMPFGSGLGSSAASACGAVVAVNKYLGNPLEKKELLPFAVLGEQVADGAYHADNVAPSLFGGMILIQDTRKLTWRRIPTPEGLLALVIHPQIKILTREAREIISPQVDLSQHIKQSSNLAGLVLGLVYSDFELIGESLDDVIIEPQRSKLIPGFAEVKSAALGAGALGCSISGAGPSIFALFDNSLKAETAERAMLDHFSGLGIGAESYLSPINQRGTYIC